MGQNNIKGIDCELYLNTGSYEAPDWVEGDCLRDFKQSLASNTGDAGTRKSRVNKKVPLTKDLNWSGSLEEDGSAVAAALYAAFMDDTPLDLLVLNGPMDGDAKGVRCTCVVTKYDTDQGREALLYPEIEVWPTIDPDGHEPQRATVAAGVLTLSPF
jgi:hypothetical protein